MDTSSLNVPSLILCEVGFIVVQLCLTLCNPMDWSMPGFLVLHCLLEFAQTHIHWVDAIQPSHPLSPPFPLALTLSQHQGLFQWVGSSHQEWPKYWSFSISPSSESGLISFRTDWFDLLAVQGTLKSLLQHHSSKASILWCSAIFMVQQLYVLNMCILFTDVYIWRILPLNTQNRTGRLEVQLWLEHMFEWDVGRERGRLSCRCQS